MSEPATKPCPQQRTRGQELALSFGRAVVLASVGYGTWRLLDLIFKKPERPIVVVLEIPEEDEA